MLVVVLGFFRAIVVAKELWMQITVVVHPFYWLVTVVVVILKILYSLALKRAFQLEGVRLVEVKGGREM